LLIALYAHANGYALFYYPKAGQFVFDPVGYFYSAFRAQNAQLLEQDEKLRADFEKFEMQRTEKAAIEFMGSVLCLRDHPVFYIIDEHNELFKPQASDDFPDYFPYQLPVLGEFVSWTSAISGNRTFILYSGNAYSRFLIQLPGGESHSIRNIGLMTDEEFQGIFSTLIFSVKDKNMSRRSIVIFWTDGLKTTSWNFSS
jgi:hypothetical protein